MAGILDTVQRASFFGIEFACSRYSVKGGIRDSVHEYRHTPGGQPEKQGRTLYVIEFDAIFSTETPAYPNAWPLDWENLRLQFEQETTADLVVPTMGTIPAYCIDWPCDVDFQKMRDGLRAKLSFREDQQTLLSVESMVDVHVASLPAQSQTLLDLTEDAGLDVSLFDQIMGIIADIESAVEFGEFQAELYLDKVAALVESCQRIEAMTKELNDSKNWQVVRALQGLGVNAVALQEGILRKLAPLIDFKVPALMSIVDVSVSLYGDTSRAVELLNLNRSPIIEDAFSIPAGTTLRAYAPSA